MRFFPLLFAAVLLLLSCGPKATTLEDFNTTDLTLPGGQIIKVETMLDTRDVMRGMMFRTSLAPDRGMLFVHKTAGQNTYWMYQTLIPLDIVWLDKDRRIVEIVPNAQPCKTEASKCLHYGGHEVAKYVLEISGGMAQKYNLKLGDLLQF